jgi:outer membrane protein, heavy metal efflux system
MTGFWRLAPAQRRAHSLSRLSTIISTALIIATAPPALAQQTTVAAPATRTPTMREQPEVTLEAILRVALEKSPDLSEAKARSHAAKESAPATSRLPDPELEYQLWAQPLARPLSLDETQMHMFGLRQAFPAPGTLGNRGDAATARADVAEQSYRARRLDLVARVERAYAAYYLADRESRLHLEHAQLTQKVVDLERAAYQAGRGTQQDVLRAGLELSRLHNDVVAIQSDRETARGLLNTLMGRAVDTPLGPPASLEVEALESRARNSARASAEKRPELAAARSAVRAEESEASASRAAGKWPSFMVGIQYMYMPTMPDTHNYGVMLSMSLPWFNPRYGEETRAAEAKVMAERSALHSVQLAADYQHYAASQRFEAARKTFATIEADLFPQAQRSFEAAQANYRGGQLDSMALFDALRALLDVRTERERALANLALAAADLERATGRSSYAPDNGAPGK